MRECMNMWLCACLYVAYFHCTFCTAPISRPSPCHRPNCPHRVEAWNWTCACFVCNTVQCSFFISQLMKAQVICVISWSLGNTFWLYLPNSFTIKNNNSNHCTSVARPALSFLISAHSTRYSHNYHNYYRLPLGAPTGCCRCRFKLSDCRSYPSFSVAVEQARNGGRRLRYTLSS